MMLTVARAHHAAANRPDSHKHADAPAAATASRVVGPASSSERLALACRPRSARVQGTAPLVSQQALSTMRLAYAYVTPTPASARMFIRRAIQAVAPDLRWSSVRLGSARGASAMRFCTPAWLDEAMRGRTFAYAGATRELVRGWGTSVLDDYLVHVALRDYPAEQRTEDIGANFRSFGWVVEVDPSCLAEPDLATVHALLCVGHPREIPRELRIGYADGCTSVVPVDILGVWDWRAAFRAMEGTGASSSSSQDRDRH